jgi:uncharacterized membrane protein YdjX (TVP38/TMEM64 family)
MGILKEWIKTLGLALYAVAAPLLGMITLIALLPDLEAAYKDNSLLMWVMYLTSILLVALALIPSVGFAAVVGYFTGSFLVSVPLVIVGIYGAVALGVFYMRRLSRESVEKIFTSRPKWQSTYNKLKSTNDSELSKLLVALRLSPHMPFALTNLLVAQAPIPFKFIVNFSWLGLLPRSLIAAYLGTAFDSLNEAMSFRPDLKTAVTLTVLVVIYCVYKVRSFRKRAG